MVFHNFIVQLPIAQKHAQNPVDRSVISPRSKLRFVLSGSADWNVFPSAAGSSD
jgi:hypothetical protein